jgi:hypothetical protein
MNKMVQTNWKNSEEKQMLKKDILCGAVTAEMTATAVYEMHDGAYKKYDLKNFQTNYHNLRKSIKKGKAKAEDEDDILANTLKEERPSIMHPTRLGNHQWCTKHSLLICLLEPQRERNPKRYINPDESIKRNMI